MSHERFVRLIQNWVSSWTRCRRTWIPNCWILGTSRIKVDCSARSEVLESDGMLLKCSSMDTVQNTATQNLFLGVVWWRKHLEGDFQICLPGRSGSKHAIFDSYSKIPKGVPISKHSFVTSLDYVIGMWWLCWNFYAVGPPARPDSIIEDEFQVVKGLNA